MRLLSKQHIYTSRQQADIANIWININFFQSVPVHLTSQSFPSYYNYSRLCYTTPLTQVIKSQCKSAKCSKLVALRMHYESIYQRMYLSTILYYRENCHIISFFPKGIFRKIFNGVNKGIFPKIDQEILP